MTLRIRTAWRFLTSQERQQDAVVTERPRWWVASSLRLILASRYQVGGGHPEPWLESWREPWRQARVLAPGSESWRQDLEAWAVPWSGLEVTFGARNQDLEVSDGKDVLERFYAVF